MRLLITGKTRSGKSTSLHLLLAALLQRSWLQVLLLDGKGVELAPYAKLRAVTYLGPTQMAGWEAALQEIATGLEDRFQALADRGLRAATPADPRILLVADEVQIGCRHRHHGRAIKQHLTRIAEQSAALADVVVLSCQREQNSLPPAVRWNCNAKLRMLGVGFFHYQPDGRPHIAGRLPYTTPEQVLEQLAVGAAGEDVPVSADSLMDLLQAEHSDRSRSGRDEVHARANATLYLGADGTGKTFQLHNHAAGRTTRRIFVDLQEPHKSWLAAIMEQCGAGIPPRATAVQLREMAVLAVRAEPTALLLDNLDGISNRERPSVHALVNAAKVAALAAPPPETPSLERKVHPFIARCRIVRIEPLSTAQARALADEHLPNDIPGRDATLRRIVGMSQGHPATIVSLCRQTSRGTLPELRHMETTPKRINLVFLLLVPLLLLLFIWRWNVDSYLLSALIMVALMVSRPFLYRSLRRQ